MAEDRAVEPVQSVDRALTILEPLARPGGRGSPRWPGARRPQEHAFRLIVHARVPPTGRQTGTVEVPLGVGVLRLAGATTARLDVVQEARQIC